MNNQCAQMQFDSFLQQIDKKVLPNFLKWVKVKSDELLQQLEPTNSDVIIKSIQEDLRSMLPADAVLPSETITYPTVGQNADIDQRRTLHVDGFLYDDDTVDELVDEGRMSRNYCRACGSHQVEPLTFVSHSTSLTQVKYMFQWLLGDLHGKTVVDVGSRLGAVLYGGYLFGNPTRIIGVEINQDLCKLQQTIVDKYQLQDRIQVVNADICTQSSILHHADVVVLNNVFEFFVPLDVQQRIWSFLYNTLRKPGAVLVLSPSLQESLRHLQVDINLDSWVKKMDITQQLAAANTEFWGSVTSEESDLEDIHLYQVIGQLPS